MMILEVTFMLSSNGVCFRFCVKQRRTSEENGGSKCKSYIFSI